MTNYLSAFAAHDIVGDGITAAAFVLFIVLFAYLVIYFAIVLLVDVVLYVLFGYGIKKIATSLDVSNAGGAYAPFYRHRVFANTADTAAIKESPSARRFSNITFWSFIVFAASALCLVACSVIFLLLSVAADGAGGILYGTSLAAAAIFVVLTILTCITIAASLTSLVFTDIAYARIFRYLGGDWWILWTVITVLIPAAGPIITACLAKRKIT